MITGIDDSTFYVPSDTTYEQWKQMQDAKYRVGKGKYTKKVLKKESDGGIIAKEALPRKTKHGERAVDWSIIQSEEYSKKFRTISDDEKVCSAIETRAKWALNNRDSLDTEELYAIDLTTGEEIARITDQQYSRSVRRTALFTRKINDADYSDKKILLIHNHPGGLPPSISDINALFENKNAVGITVGHNGSIYYYTRPKRKIPEIDFLVKVRHFNQYDEITNLEKAMEELSKEFEFEFYKL